jgi:hypothetical protein
LRSRRRFRRSGAVRTERVKLDGPARSRIIEGRITGNETVDYLVSANRSQIFSVDTQDSYANGIDEKVGPAGLIRIAASASVASWIQPTSSPSKFD